MALPEISLDPRNEQQLLEQAAQYAISKSGGQLGNLSPANPLIFLLEAQVFAGAELLWYLNQLPQKLLVTFLNYWGVSVSDGVAATGDLTVTLTGSLATSITLPSGLLFSDGEVLYKSISPVIVPAGSTSATVPVQCTEVGVLGNKPAYTINNIVTPNAYLKTATNPLQFSTGLDVVGADQAVSGFVDNLRSEQCISEGDFIRVSQGFLGAGWDVRILANTNPTTSQNEIGTVAVLIGNPKNIDTPTATTIALQKHLTNKAPITSRVWVSTIQYQPTVIKVYATYSEEQDTQDLANQLYGIIQEGLLTTPTKLTDRDLIMLGDRVGVKVTASSLNGSSSVSAGSVSSALYLKYLEIQLTPNNSDMIRGDDTRLLWGSESGELFIFGQGDED
jgi:hypothetical protein